MAKPHKLNPQPFTEGSPGSIRIRAGVKPKSRAELLDFIDLCRTEAERTGYKLDKALWRTIEALLDKAQEGDVKAAKIVLERFFGAVDKAPVVQVGVEVNEASKVGPPIPSAEQLSETVQSMLRLVRDDQSFHVVDAEVVETDEDEDFIEDFLS